MSKKNKSQIQELHQEEEMFDFDFNDLDHSDNNMVDFMNTVLQTSTEQMKIAVELTKIAIGSGDIANRDEHVFAVFQKAMKTVEKNFSLKNIMTQIEQ